MPWLIALLALVGPVVAPNFRAAGGAPDPYAEAIGHAIGLVPAALIVVVRAVRRRLTVLELTLFLGGSAFAAWALHHTWSERSSWVARREAAKCYTFQCQLGAVLANASKPREMRRKALVALAGPGDLSARLEAAGNAVDEILHDPELARQSCGYAVAKGALACSVHGTPKLTGVYPPRREPKCTSPVAVPADISP